MEPDEKEENISISTRIIGTILLFIALFLMGYIASTGGMLE